MPNIVITSMGIISAIGDNVEQNWQSLINKKHGISRLENINSIHKNKLLVGEIKRSNEYFIDLLNLKKNNSWTRTSLLAAIAIKELIDNYDNVIDSDVGLISSTTVGGMDINENHYLNFLKSDSYIRYIDSNHAGDSSKKLADYFGMKNLVSNISTACSSSANAIIFGANLIKAGRLDRVIVGGTDALSKFTLNGFNTLMIYSDELNSPFDENRKGLNLGEGAAFLMLENENFAKKNKTKILGYLSGYGNANDAFHQTASSETGEGAFLSIQKSLKMANIAPSSLDYINVHGTATPNNDLSEGTALRRIFTEKVPDFSSTKPYTGHTLAAAAVIEAVFSILALKNQLIYPNLNFKNKMKEFSFVPNLEIKTKEIKNILSNSFGFGGNCSSLIFSKNNL